MRSKHYRLSGRDWACGIEFRPIVLLYAVLTTATLFICGTANAQFSGPALGATTPVNPVVTPTTDPAILYPASRDIHLGPGDLIAVHIYGSPDYTPPVRVSLDGIVQLPLINAISVQGLTVNEAEKRIAEQLVNAGMYRNPQVIIQVMESPNQVVTVTGEVHGIVPLLGEKRLFDALAAVGGLPPTASHIVTINRPEIDQPIVVDLGTDPARSKFANVPLFAKDTIVVSKVGVVYVLGAFRSQGAYAITQNSPLTLMQVTALSGGTGFEGKNDDLRLIRTVGTDRKVVRVDIKRILHGKDPDPVLQADDIIFLPSDSMKSAIKSGGIGTLLGLASLLIVAVRP